MITSDKYCMTEAQFSQLQDAVQALDTHLLRCVHAIENQKWSRASIKSIADIRTCKLVRKVGICLTVNSATQETRYARTPLLSPRVRATLRVFNKNPQYCRTDMPDILWDEEMIPGRLYQDVEGALASLAADLPATDVDISRDGPDGNSKGKPQDIGSGSAMASGEMAGMLMDDHSKGKSGDTGSGSVMDRGEVAGWKENDKGKGKEKEKETVGLSIDEGEGQKDAQMVVNPLGDKSSKRPRNLRVTNRSAVMDDDVGDYLLDYIPDRVDEDEPPAKKARRKKVSADVDSPPSPCTRCEIEGHPCEPKGWRAACTRCKKKRQACSIAKLYPPSLGESPCQPSQVPLGLQLSRKSPSVTQQPMTERYVGKIRIRPGSTAAPARRKLTTQAPHEACLTPTPVTPPGETDLQMIQKTLDEQDKRIRELEAGQSVLRKQVEDSEQSIRQLQNRAKEDNFGFGKTFAKIQYVDRCIEGMKERQEHVVREELDRLTIRVFSQLDKTKVDLQSHSQGLMETMVKEDRRREEELRSAERRWRDEIERMEPRLEKRQDEHKTTMRQKAQGHAMGTEHIHRTLQESLERLGTIGLKDPWQHELDRRDQSRRQEWALALQQRLTSDQVTASHAALSTTIRTIVNELAIYASTDHASMTDVTSQDTKASATAFMRPTVKTVTRESSRSVMRQCQ